MNDLALLGVSLYNRSKRAKEVLVCAFACGMELPSYGALRRTPLGLGRLPALLAALFERILERRGKASECFRSHRLITLHALDQRDNVVDSSSYFVDHGQVPIVMSWQGRARCSATKGGGGGAMVLVPDYDTRMRARA